MTTTITTARAQNPFIGLRPFDELHANLFFGRTAQETKLLAKLGETRFIAIVGTSACGKSSLVLAGLVPRLRRGSIQEAGKKWRIARLRPGSSPIGALADALAEPGVLIDALAESDEAERCATMAHALRRSELGLVDVVFRAGLNDDESLLVIVDQFEELFTYAGSAANAADPAEAAAFVQLLLTAAAWQDLPIYVALTMRSDFLGECARFRYLPETITEGLFLVPRMARDEIRLAIVEPVEHAGARITPQLVSRLLNDIGRDSDQLPVLQHALMRTWNEWERRNEPGTPIDIDHYHTIGEMGGALAQHAGEIYGALEPPTLQTTAQKLFRCLTARDAENRYVRRPTAFAPAVAIVDAPEDDLIALIATYSDPDVSFLTTNPPGACHGAVLDISHESLMRLWHDLRGWVDDDADVGDTYRALVDDATNGRPPWQNADLAVAEARFAKNAPVMNPAWAVRYDDELRDRPLDDGPRGVLAVERYDAAMRFLKESADAPRKRREQEERAHRRALAEGRRQALATTAAMCVLAVLAVVLIGWKVTTDARNRANAVVETAEREAQERVAASQREVAEMSRAFNLRVNRDLRQIKIDQRQIAAMRAVNKTNAERAAAQQRRADRDLRAARRETAVAKVGQTYSDAVAEYLADDATSALADVNDAIVRGTALNVGNRMLARLYELRGSAKAKRNDRRDGLADINHAIALDPSYTGALVERAFIVDDFASNLADYNRALKINPNLVEALVSRGAIYNNRAVADMNAGRLGPAERGFLAALRDFDAAVKLAPLKPAYKHSRDRVAARLEHVRARIRAQSSV